MQVSYIILRALCVCLARGLRWVSVSNGLRDYDPSPKVHNLHCYWSTLLNLAAGNGENEKRTGLRFNGESGGETAVSKAPILYIKTEDCPKKTSWKWPLCFELAGNFQEVIGCLVLRVSVGEPNAGLGWN